MPRQSAENQRRYRQRKKDNPQWRDNEVSRVQSYYKPSSILTLKELEKRREKVRRAVAKSREKKKADESLDENCNDRQEDVPNIDSMKTTRSSYSFYRCKYCLCNFYNFSIYKNHTKSHEIIYCKFWATRGNGLACKCGYVVQGSILRTHTGCHEWKEARRFRKSKHFAYSHIQPNRITALYRNIALKPAPLRAKQGLIAYDAQKHSLPQHECPHCGYAFRKLKNLEMHLKVHTGEAKYKCDECDRHFVSKTGLQYHKLSKHTTDKPYACEMCGRRFIKFQHMERHKRTHLVEKPFKCTICNKSYITNSNLKVHERTHLGEKQFHCKYCGQGFWQKGHMKDHLLYMHGQVPKTKLGKRNHCDICNKTFLREKNLVDHYRTHTGERPFICTFCGQGFTRNGLLLRHMRMHTGNQRYKCDQCDQAFTAPQNLRRHVMRNHSGVKPYICEICNKGFAFISDLRTHEQIHLPESDKPHKCNICDRGFSVESKLKIHLQSHNAPAERLFECEYLDCNKSFATASRRARHHHTHTGTKNYKCPKCERAFSQPGNLKRHVRNHDGNKPFKCLFCDYCSAEKGNLKRHVKFKHPPEYTEANIAIMIDIANGNINPLENLNNPTDNHSNNGLSKALNETSQDNTSSNGLVHVASKAPVGTSQDNASSDNVVPGLSNAPGETNQTLMTSNSVAEGDHIGFNEGPSVFSASLETNHDISASIVPIELKMSQGISKDLPPLFDGECASIESAICMGGNLTFGANDTEYFQNNNNNVK